MLRVGSVIMQSAQVSHFQSLNLGLEVVHLSGKAVRLQHYAYLVQTTIRDCFGVWNHVKWHEVDLKDLRQPCQRDPRHSG